MIKTLARGKMSKTHQPLVIRRIARYKNYLARSNGYLLVATFGLSLRNFFTDWKIIPAFILGIMFMLLLGWLDCKLGFFKEESLHMAKQNPILLEIRDDVRNIQGEVRKR